MPTPCGMDSRLYQVSLVLSPSLERICQLDTMATKKDETYYLVKWLDVEDFSVIPESYFSPGSDLGVGCYTQATKGYTSAQILKISGECTGSTI